MVRLKEICKVDWGNTNLTKAAYTEGGEYLGVSATGCDGKFNYCFVKTKSCISQNIVL